MTALVIFTITYIGVALGRIPGLVIDRVGIALLGAIAMIVFGVLTPTEAVRSIDLPTILLLYALMVLSAQLRLGGFYTWTASRIVFLLKRPNLFLLASMMVSALLSSVLANDIVCFAFTPVLVATTLYAKLNPLPFLIGLAVSSNIGSAATIIGNPQNMLIGQVGQQDFAQFLFWCGPPALMSLAGSYLVLLLIYRKKIYQPFEFHSVTDKQKPPVFDRWQSLKGIIVIAMMVVLFFTPIPREISAIGIAGILLCSRRMKTREILGLVDWHLITLFCALFIVIHGVSLAGYPQLAVTYLADKGIDLHNLLVLTGVSTVLSNVFSNVPATMLLIRFLDAANPAQWFALAVSSTFAGNLIIIGSIANLIVVEQAEIHGVKITFLDHAAAGLPVTLLSLFILIGWILI